MAIPKNVFLGLIYKFPFTGITALRLCVLTSKNVRLYALTQMKTQAPPVFFCVTPRGAERMPRPPGSIVIGSQHERVIGGRFRSLA